MEKKKKKKEEKGQQRRLTKKDKTCFRCGQTGHLAKVCRHGDEQKKHATYNPPRRIQFKTQQDVEAFRERLAAFRTDSSQHKHLQSYLYQPLLKETLQYLVWRFGQSKDLLCPARRIVLAFGGTVSGGGQHGSTGSFGIAETNSLYGTITFSKEALEHDITDGTRSGYPEEEPYVRKWCRCKEDYLLWLLLHEFTHLFVGCSHDRHDGEFFDRVEGLARQNEWLFSSAADADDTNETPGSNNDE